MQQQEQPEYLVVAIVVMEDEPVHTDEHPFCTDLHCPCHEDCQLINEHITEPLLAGLMTDSEAIRLYQNRQLVA